MSHVTRINKSCHTYEWVMPFEWMRHVTNKMSFWSPMDLIESCHTYEWDTSRIWMSHVTYKWVVSHIQMSHVTHMDESCHTYEWDTSHIWMSHVTYKWVVSHIRMSHVTNINKSWPMSEWVMSFIINESCHTYEWVCLTNTATPCNILYHWNTREGIYRVAKTHRIP